MKVRAIVLAGLLCLPFAGLADEAKGKTDVIKVKTVRWSPAAEKYEPYAAVTLLVSRGVKGVVANRRAKDATYTTTDDDGAATLEFDSGSPITLVSHRGKDKIIPEVLSLASRGGDTHEVVIALVAAKDYPEFQKKNPGAAPAHQKVKQAYNATPAEVFKTPEGKQMQKELSELYKETRPASSVLAPAFFKKDSLAWKELADAGAKFGGVPITAIVKMDGFQQVPQLQKAGVRVLGYVDAGYGKRVKEAEADVKRWYEIAPTVEGIYIDKQAAQEKDVASNAGLAKSIRGHAARGDRAAPIIVGNCGSDFARALLDDDLNHATCCFQSNAANVPEEVRLPEWVEMSCPGRAAVLLTNVRRQDDMERIVQSLLRREVGYFFVSDRQDASFAELPSPDFWRRMFAVVEAANQQDLAPGGMPDSDLGAATWVLSVRGTVQVTGKVGTDVRKVADLPKTSFRLLHVDLQGKRVTDADLARLKGCTDVTFLRLDGNPKITDEGLVMFKEYKDLKHLELGGTRVTNAGLVNFRDCEGLTYLGVYDTAVGDDGLRHLRECKDLKWVQLGLTKITNASLLQLSECERLETIDLTQTRVDDRGLQHLHKCEQLKTVFLKGTSATPAGAARLRKAVPGIKQLIGP